MKILFRFFATYSAFAISVFAWNKPGHMVTGSIAFWDLKQNHPKTVANVIAALKAHPAYKHWDSMATDAGLTGDARDEFFFMMAARWPDDARGTPDHRETWHFINHPFTPDGTTGTTIPTPHFGDLEIQLDANFSAAKPGNSAPEPRAKAAAWLFHLVGDAHQPLHSTGLYSSKQSGWKDGDRGGNEFYVVPIKGQTPTKLHSYWDGLVLDDDTATDVSRTAKNLMKKTSRQALKLPSGQSWDPKGWVAESVDLARTSGYTEKGKLISGDDDTHSVLKPLTATYRQEAKRVADLRATLAGYRLADALSEAFGTK